MTQEMILTVLAVLLALFCVYVAVDEYKFYHGKPGRSIEQIQTEIEFLENEIEQNRKNPSYPMQYAYDALDALAIELRRAESWNKRHPEDKV